MPIQIDQLRTPLQAFDFKALFTRGLGWITAKAALPTMDADGKTYVFTPIAEQGGLIVAECVVVASDPQGHLPPVTTRRKLSNEFARLHYEHILIFTDIKRTTSVWLWPKRDDGKTKSREQTYRKGQPGDLLLSKLAGIAFTLDELDDTGRASITEVSERVTRAFDVERITRRFYDNFKLEHDHFQAFLKGVKDAAHQAWYTSVMLNRLMFLYFIQKKGFLNNDTNYLRTQLVASQKRGADRFYRDFLLILFFEGLASEPRGRSTATNVLLGSVPYLNGGIFMPHQIEEANAGIELPDSVFERLFDFFDRYTWHLDDRPLRADNEINPDVLGYIFEKYINQKQMGAYYTKEDITDYICKYTILPFLLDKIELNVAQELTSIDPFIYEAVKTDEYLPTETEREYAARQKRYEQIGLDFAANKIATVNDLITYNLDIRAFASDWLSRLDAPVMLRRFYTALTNLTVLDPTCGSGAFLFSAMNILEPLYEGCLRKMAEFIARPDSRGFADFQAELERVNAHPNERYFIFKSIIINNLYGVDIMEEAVEICKLRLFLKLIAQVSDVRRVEPLPDIDFNIRAGNTLVGFATEAEIQADLFAQAILPQIKVMAGTLQTFRQQQLQSGVAPGTLKELKANVRRVQSEIVNTLDKALMDQYGQQNLTAFRASHKPFHWYAEYNGVMTNGGFDVIVGNPPYVEYSKVKKDYTIQGYETEKCGNLYALMLERCLSLRIKGFSYLGMIVPLSICSGERFDLLRTIISVNMSPLYLSNYEIFPSRLFEGAFQRLTIVIGKQQDVQLPQPFVTKLRRWYSSERPELMHVTHYIPYQDYTRTTTVAKYDSLLQSEVLRKIWFGSNAYSIKRFTTLKRTEIFVFYQEATNYWMKASCRIPFYQKNGLVTTPAHGRTMFFDKQSTANVVMAIMNSSLFYMWFATYSDGFHLSDSLVKDFPVHPDLLENKTLIEISRRLDTDVRANSIIATRNTKTDQINVESFLMGASKPIIDEIDRVLAQHYGFTDEELDFIINYDIKYRMGRDAESEDAGGE